METETVSTLTKRALQVGIGIALFLGGAAVYPFVEQYVTTPIGEMEIGSSIGTTRSSGYDEGFAAARKLVEESSIGNFFHTQINRSTINGTVTAIQGNRISIHDGSVQNDSLNILFDVPFVIDRTIIADDNTKVVKLGENTSMASQTKTNGYQIVQQIKPNEPLPVASSTGAYTETPSSVSAINIGDVLIVVAGENTKTATEFVAQKILITPSVK